MQGTVGFAAHKKKHDNKEIKVITLVYSQVFSLPKLSNCRNKVKYQTEVSVFGVSMISNSVG